MRPVSFAGVARTRRRGRERSSRLVTRRRPRTTPAGPSRSTTPSPAASAPSAVPTRTAGRRRRDGGPDGLGAVSCSARRPSAVAEGLAATDDPVAAAKAPAKATVGRAVAACLRAACEGEAWEPRRPGDDDERQLWLDDVAAHDGPRLLLELLPRGRTRTASRTAAATTRVRDLVGLSARAATPGRGRRENRAESGRRCFFCTCGGHGALPDGRRFDP